MPDINFDNMEKGSFFKESIHILHDAYISKKLILFIGSGADRDSGLPLWDDAIKIFCKHLSISPNGADNLKIPQLYYNSRGRKEYVELCREIFGYGRELHANELHDKIIEFNVNTLITTNYTDILGQELRNRGRIYKTICQDKDLPYVKNENLIIKMHGDFEHDNFVLKEDDYLSYSNNFRLMETYIKAVIAKNVVLFIGYSYSDPDVKQLFSWVKDVLGNDFQQAYMLEGFKNYDENEFDYYKNLGVNVIFTSSFDEEKDNKTNLLAVLDLIKDGYKENISNVEEAKKYFLPFLNLDYILDRYVCKGLFKCKLITEGNVLTYYHSGKSQENESEQLLNKLAGYVHQENVDPNDAYSVIADILRKSSIDFIVTDKTRMMGDSIKIPHSKNQLFDLIMEFDYAELRQVAEHDDFFNSNDEKIYLRQAYIYYFLEEYTKAYTALCKAAETAYKKQLYNLYYIAQFNKCKIKNYVEQSLNVSEDILKKINKDVASIHLDRILMDMPDSSSENYQMLKDIESFQLQYSLFQDAYRVSEKVKEQQDTTYSIFSGVPDYFILQRMIKDYHSYLVYNSLMIDNYREVREVFTLYVKSILKSAAAPDKKAEYEIYQSGNVHAPDIGTFELSLIIKYMSEKDITNMLSEYGINMLPVDKQCKGHMKKVLKNLRPEKSLRCDGEFWNCLIVLSHMELDAETVEMALDGISEKFNYYSFRLHKNVIYKFLFMCHNNKAFKKKNAGKFHIYDYALGRFLENLLKQTESADYDSVRRYSKIIQIVANMIYDVYKEPVYLDLHYFLNDERSLIAAKIYPYCSEEDQEMTVKYFENNLKNLTWKSYELYYEIVTDDIVKPNAEYERKIFMDINNIKRLYINRIPNEYENVLTTMCNLYLNDKITDVETLKGIIKNSEQDHLKFLSDIENFDYRKFNIEWLTSFHKDLLMDISQNETAKRNIIRKFCEKIEVGEISNQLLKLYFKYFTGVC